MPANHLFNSFATVKPVNTANQTHGDLFCRLRYSYRSANYRAPVFHVSEIQTDVIHIY